MHGIFNKHTASNWWSVIRIKERVLNPSEADQHSVLLLTFGIACVLYNNGVGAH